MNTARKYNRDRNGKLPPSFYILVSVIFFLVILLFVLYYIAVANTKVELRTDETSAEEPGQAYSFTKFYYANKGTWILKNKMTPVLKERKYISPGELEKYLVYPAEAGTKVRIVEARQRWKKVDVLDRNNRKVATGWLDAHNVRNVEKVDRNE